MAGAGTTVKSRKLLALPATVTITLPVVVDGTIAVIDVLLHAVTLALTPLKSTVDPPWLLPKFAPAITTVAVTGAVSGVRDVKTGETVTVNVRLLLATPPTVTMTGPVVAPAGTGTVMEPVAQLVGVAVTPLKVTVDAPCVAPKLLPAITTEVPTSPAFGVKDESDGARMTVKLSPLLATPPTVTTTFPVVAVAGTGTLIEVSAQDVGVAVTPLNLTVDAPWVAPKFTPVIVTAVPMTPMFGVKLAKDGPGRNDAIADAR